MSCVKVLSVVLIVSVIAILLLVFLPHELNVLTTKAIAFWTGDEPNSEKPHKIIPKYRADYVYSEEAKAFYKIYLEEAYFFKARRICQHDGAELISSDPQDLTIAQKLYDDEGNEGETISFLDEYQEFRGQDQCRVLESNGQVRLKNCFSNADSFVCKVDAYQVQYDARCKTFYVRDGTISAYTPNVALGSCYSMPNYTLTWQKAEDRCELDGGHLAVINSQQEADFIRDFVREKDHNAVEDSLNPSYLAIGFSFAYRDNNGQRVFTSVFGRTLAEEGFEKWAPGEPSNAGNRENCGSWFADVPGLNDANCDDLYGFVCEKEMHCDCCTPNCLGKQ